MSPEVGASSPAIMRSRVVLPEPDGPRNTRNSPSSVTRSTSFTAPSVPCLKTLVTARVSTIAMWELLPAAEDTLVLGLQTFGAILRRLVTARNLGEPGRQHERPERLVDAGAGETGIPNVGRPVENVGQDLVLVGCIRSRIVGDRSLEVGHRLLEAREVVEPAGVETVVERV